MHFIAATVQTAVSWAPEQEECMVRGWLAELGRPALIDLYTTLSTGGMSSGAGGQGVSAEENDVIARAAAVCLPPAP